MTFVWSNIGHRCIMCLAAYGRYDIVITLCLFGVSLHITLRLGIWHGSLKLWLVKVHLRFLACGVLVSL